jgi:hypothetical protein
VDDALNDPLPIYEPQPVALKATSSREVLPSKVAQVEAVKGKCALGPFLSILVIECQHKWTCVNLCKVIDKVQIK